MKDKEFKAKYKVKGTRAYLKYIKRKVIPALRSIDGQVIIINKKTFWVSRKGVLPATTV